MGPSYSMMWSARASSEGGIVRPIAWAVLRLITSLDIDDTPSGVFSRARETRSHFLRARSRWALATSRRSYVA